MKYQSKLYYMGKNCCLIWAYIYACGIKFDLIKYIKLVLEMQKRGFIDNECYCLDGTKIVRYLLKDSTARVIKRKIETIKDIKERTPVLYNYCNYEHWVVVENGKIVFNEWDDSNAIKYGTPVSARVIKRG